MQSILRCAVCALLLAAVAFAQTDRGTITGTVSDPAGAVVPNAPMELVNTQTGALYQAATSETGNYSFVQLPIGVYRLQVTVPGFKTYVRENLTLAAFQTLRQDIVLEVGTAAESVTVTADVSLLKTESGEVSYSVKGQRLTSLPILPIGNGYSSSHGVRNPMAVANLAPGTFFDPNLNIRVNGAPSNTESIRIDGQDSTNGVVTFSQAQTQPSVEALEELTIQTSNYAAEFGQAGAGMFNYTTRSGTNQWHGGLYDYNSNEFYNAAQSFKKEKPRLRRDNYGGNLGGPVWIPGVYNGRDRTFFFWGYEVFREKGIISNQSPTVPTAAYRAGDFTTALSGRPITNNPADVTGQRAIDGQIFDPNTEFRASDNRRVRTPFPNNMIPAARFDPSAVKLLALIPLPTVPNALVQNYNNPYITDRNTNIPSLKLDHNFNARQKLSFYWSTTETAVQYCTPLCGSDGLPDPITATRGTFIESYTLRLNYDYTLSPSMLLHLGAGLLSNDFKDTAPTTNFDVEKVLGIKGAKQGPNNGGRFPIFIGMLGSNSQGGMNNMGPAAGQVRAIEQKPTFNLSLSWVKGNHTFKYGGEFRTEGFIDRVFTAATGRFTFNAAETGNPWFSDAGVAITGGALGFPFASVMLGRVNQVDLSDLPSTRGGRKFLAFYAQDTWKVTRRLTLDYGLRYDYATYAKEQYGRTPAFSGNVVNTTAGGHLGGTIFEATCNCNFARNYPHGWGPRVGVAYQITDKTVFRAGFGITYASVLAGSRQGAAGAQLSANAPGVGDPAMILSEGFPLNPNWPDLRANLFPDPRSFAGQPGVFDQNSGRPARQFQWSVGLQQEVAGGIVVEAAYVANRGNWWRTASLSPYNVLSFERLEQYGLNILNAADRTILAAQVQQAAAGRFRNQIPFSGFPTNFSVARSLTDYPQFGTLTGAGPLGKTWYDSLQLKVNKRYSYGLDLTFNYTYSKELQLGVESDAGGGIINDILNRDTNKQFSSFSQPHATVVAANYQVPRWGPNRWVRNIASDWTVSGVFRYTSGMPIPTPTTALATSNLGAALLRGTRAMRVEGQPLFLQDLNCHCFDPSQVQVLNPAAWTDPPAGTFTPSAAYYNDYRYQRRPRETFSFGRVFRLGERAQLWIRAEFTNAFNRAQTPNPISNGYTTGVSRTAAVIGGTGENRKTVTVNNTGFGVIATQPVNAVIGERSGLLVGRLTF
jgi:hypothetical protein